MKIATICAMVAAAAILIVMTGGCNTVQGMGEDLQSLGRGMEKSASD
ncbi:MAG: entericidin A/B family lipoprotein [Verrucomicrobiota bacterium]